MTQKLKVDTPPKFTNIPTEHILTPARLRTMLKENPHTSLWVINNTNSGEYGDLPSGEVSHTLRVGDENVTIKLYRTRLPQDVTLQGVSLEACMAHTRFVKAIQRDSETRREPQLIAVTEEYANSVVESVWGIREEERIGKRISTLNALINQKTGDTETAMFTDEQTDRTSTVITSEEDLWEKRQNSVTRNISSIAPDWDTEEEGALEAIKIMVKQTNEVGSETEAVNLFKSRQTYTAEEAAYIGSNTKWAKVKKVFERTLSEHAK